MMGQPSKLPTWATDGGTTLEPSEGQKAAGFAVSTKPPARWMNYDLNLIYQWIDHLRPLAALGVANWSEMSNPKAKNLYAIIGNPQGQSMIAVGEADGTDAYIVALSGSTGLWTEKANPKNKTLYALAKKSNLTIAAGVADGTDAYLITTDLGETWTEQSNPKNFDIYGLCYDATLGLFVGVGAADGTDAYIITSSDGITWTERANPKNVTLRAVASNGFGTIIAVGDADGADAYIVKSTNGTSWSEMSNPQNLTLRSIATSVVPGVWVAGGDGYLLRCSDGATWVQQSSFGNVVAVSHDYYQQLFVALTSGSLYTSWDGADWKQRPRSAGSTNMSCAASYPGALGKWVQWYIAGAPDATDALIAQSLNIPLI